MDCLLAHTTSLPVVIARQDFKAGGALLNKPETTRILFQPGTKPSRHPGDLGLRSMHQATKVVSEITIHVLIWVMSFPQRLRSPR